MNAQEFQKSIFIEGNDTLPFNFLLPAGFNSTETKITDNEKVKFPIVIFMHGSGERGNDNEVQINHIRELFLDSVNRKKYPSFILAPQCPLKKKWVESSWKVSKHIMPEKESVPMKMTMHLLEKLLQKYPIDTKRIYVTGLSMGGFGAWDMICRYPQKFAAAIPICGGGDTSKAELIKDIPVWAFHGSNDKVVKVILTRNMINALKLAGGTPRYTEYKGVDHDCWINAYKEKDLLKWLFSQKLN